MIYEGSFVMVPTTEGVMHGVDEAQPAFGKSLWDGSAFRFTKH
jgi:hypothetical protein